MATMRRDTPGNTQLQTPPARNELTALELVDFLHRRAVNELIVVEGDPGRYHLQARISWRPRQRAFLLPTSVATVVCTRPMGTSNPRAPGHGRCACLRVADAPRPIEPGGHRRGATA